MHQRRRLRASESRARSSRVTASARRCARRAHARAGRSCTTSTTTSGDEVDVCLPDNEACGPTPAVRPKDAGAPDASVGRRLQRACAAVDAGPVQARAARMLASPTAATAATIAMSRRASASPRPAICGAGAAATTRGQPTPAARRLRLRRRLPLRPRRRRTQLHRTGGWHRIQPLLRRSWVIPVRRRSTTLRRTRRRSSPRSLPTSRRPSPCRRS